jgi:hypothetical protein
VKTFKLLNKKDSSNTNTCERNHSYKLKRYHGARPSTLIESMSARKRQTVLVRNMNREILIKWSDNINHTSIIINQVIIIGQQELKLKEFFSNLFNHIDIWKTFTSHWKTSIFDRKMFCKLLIYCEISDLTKSFYNNCFNFLLLSYFNITVTYLFFEENAVRHVMHFLSVPKKV